MFSSFHRLRFCLDWLRAAVLSTLFANVIPTPLPFFCDLISVPPFQHLVGFRNNQEKALAC